MTKRRILSIWLPRLAIERWAKASDAAPDAAVVLVVEGAHGQLISAVTDAARESGARVGARLTDARALDPTLVAASADLAGDAELLERLARWAGRWSPLVEVDGADGLRLDVTGAAHLFGGEAALQDEVEARFAGLGLTVRSAIAPTAGAAWALARYSLSPGRGRETRSVGRVRATSLPPSPSHACGAGPSLSRGERGWRTSSPRSLSRRFASPPARPTR